MIGSKTGIVIITFNTPSLILPQLESIERFCQDDFEIIVADNSSEKSASQAIEYHARNHRFLRLETKTTNPSMSHASACNKAWEMLKDKFDYLLFLDHDNFPFKPFSVVEMLQGKSLGGLGQKKSKTYFWPGFFMAHTSICELDFSPAHGLDTGGNIHKAIERAGIENCVFFGEEHCANNEIQPGKTPYVFYSVIAKRFMHFINASNWAGNENHEERINSLLNILKNRTDESES